jgi:hypothetical protein
MNPADEYRIKAGDMISLARAEADPFQKGEYERLAAGYIRLAEQSERNSRTDLVYEMPPQPPVAQQQQQQQQPQPKTEDKLE